MSTPEQDLSQVALRIAQSAQAASRQLATLHPSRLTAGILASADHIEKSRAAILEANAVDVAAATERGIAAPLVERLRLNDKRLASMVSAARQIAAQESPVGRVEIGYTRPNGLRIEKIRVPLGVVLFIYESRPNVTSDAAALALRSANAIILRGGKESIASNRAVAAAIHRGLESVDINPACVGLVELTDRALLPELLKLDTLIDLVVPRGGESLIRAVAGMSRIPVLKHYTGNCHVYIDQYTDRSRSMVRDICVNAKTGYPGGAVCNAAEKLLFHREAAPKFLAEVCDELAARGVEVRGDDRTRQLWPKAVATVEADWPTEYLALQIAVKVVDSLDEAIAHINKYGSRHTDAIITQDVAAADQFVREVDSASVMVNASTRFADGGEYGLGAELGISTDKLHARGPMGAADMTTGKWVVRGEGHIRT